MPFNFKPSFILDVHLGKLAKQLRMLGFDALWKDDFTDEEIVRTGREGERVILTRDRKLLEERRPPKGYFVSQTDPKEQVKEIVSKFGLAKLMDPFTVCMECNGRIESVKKERIEGLLEPDTRKAFQEFFQCQDCGRVYWKGSHYDRMMALVNELGGSRNH